MVGKVITVGAIVAAILLFMMINFTTPASAGPIGILIVFLLFYVVILGITTFFVFISSKLLVKVGAAMSLRHPIKAVDIKRSYYYGSLFALVPPILIGMQSVGSVSIYEVGLIMMFIVLGCIYVTKRVS